MKLAGIPWGVALVLSTIVSPRAEELRSAEQVSTAPRELALEQLDRVTAAGQLGDRARRAFVQLAFPLIVGGLSEGPRSSAAIGAYVLSEFVKLEILIAQRGL
ncbi:MAG: hypothetical protein RMK73_14680 [Geminicoccaceae bacterium]|nr:hypothetical protein [Geminicoccaceae bacterium]MDW8342726.1 hypothetical protein [Geminicoccaceae bacterium]